MTSAIPDLARLVERVRQDCPNLRSMLHGEEHWKCVAWTGIELLSQEHADRLVVFLFGLLHDCQREDDGFDSDHGRRAATYIERLSPDLLRITHERHALLYDACAGHADGGISADPTIGLCWDADRLNLWRISVYPEIKYLSTASARDGTVIARAQKFVGKSKTWGELLSAAIG